MKTINFEWNEIKNRLNIKKHGVSFDEASSVFYDERAIVFDDPDHSKDEDRFLILGVSKNYVFASSAIVIATKTRLSALSRLEEQLNARSTRIIIKKEDY